MTKQAASEGNTPQLEEGLRLDGDGNIVTKDGVIIPRAKIGAEVEKGWHRATIDRRMFKPEICQGYAVRGYLTSADQFESDKTGPFTAYTVRLTQPTVVCSDEDDEKLSAALPGQDVLVVCTGALVKLDLLLSDPNNFSEVVITPIKKIGISGGRSYWRYQVDFAGKKTPRQHVVGELAGSIQEVRNLPPKKIETPAAAPQGAPTGATAT